MDGIRISDAMLLKPGQLEEFTGFAPHVLRNWRKDGWLDGLGKKQPSGHWKYPIHDAFILATCTHLRRYGIESVFALHFAKAIVRDLWKIWGVHKGEQGTKGMPYHVIWDDTAVHHSRKRFPNPEKRPRTYPYGHSSDTEIEGFNQSVPSPAKVIIDVQSLGAMFTDHLAEVLKEDIDAAAALYTPIAEPKKVGKAS